RRLQSNGSRAAKRKLKAISGREERRVKHVNHETSKAVVDEALRAGAAEIRMEDLTHIRASIKAGKRIRARLHRWAFRQLQDFVYYKAKAAGLRATYTDPAHTSQTCSVCGAIGKRERHLFSCACGTRLHADVNASKNIAGFATPTGLARGVRNSSRIFAHQASPPAAKSPSL
ncbi:MAG: transposase, partial [Nitrospirota bacterium]|nr:transposase [Nitrospirota bacterium]